MGEVYRARDTELGRDVAIKVLPPAVAQDSGKDHLVRLVARWPTHRLRGARRQGPIAFVSILFFMSVSPDGAWLLARVPPGPHAGSGVAAFFTQDGHAVPVCTDCEADWSPGGELFVMRSNGRSVVIPVTSAARLPNLPAGGLRVEAGSAGLTFPVGDGFRCPGRDASQYAYMKASLQRNIYRVPLP